MSKKKSKVKAAEFWNWFSTNNSKYLFLSDMDEIQKDIVMEEMLVQLHQYCDNLYFEIGGHPDDEKAELVITAEGVREYFGKVEELVDAAPELSQWTIVKFKQPNGPGFITKFSDREFDPDKISFISLYTEELPESVGIRVCYPDFNEEDKNMFITATYIMIDCLLGEKSSVLDLDYLEVEKTPDDFVEENHPMLSSLVQLIKERKQFKYPFTNFKVVETTDEKDYSILVTANVGYQHYKFKNEFPWLLLIIVEIRNSNENGHPDDEEADVLNSFEDFLDGELKQHAILHYVGRTTKYKQREIIYYLDSPVEVNAFLLHLRESDDPLRNFTYRLEEDAKWQHAEHMFNRMDRK